MSNNKANIIDAICKDIAKSNPNDPAVTQILSTAKEISSNISTCSDEQFVNWCKDVAAVLAKSKKQKR